MSKGRWALLGIGFFSAGALITASVGHTYAAYSDFQVVHASANAGTWGSPTPPTSPTPDEPQACKDAGLTFAPSHVVVLAPGTPMYSAPGNSAAPPPKNEGFLIFVNSAAGTSDTVTGSDHADCIVGGAGDDTLNGGSQDDVLIGGAGDDTLNGGNGKDRLYGEAGDDILNGGNGKDVILSGGPGNDTINGDNGADTVDGGDGVDHCNGGRAPDQLTGCEFADGTAVSP